MRAQKPGCTRVMRGRIGAANADTNGALMPEIPDPEHVAYTKDVLVVHDLMTQYKVLIDMPMMDNITYQRLVTELVDWKRSGR